MIFSMFQVVDGNMIVKMAVKDTPTLIGNKLHQSYFKVFFLIIIKFLYIKHSKINSNIFALW